MAGLGETIINTLKFAAGGEGEVQQRVLNKQTIDDNQRKLDQKRDRDVAASIDGSELRQFVKKGDPSDPASPLFTVDIVGMWQANPEVAAEFFNTISKSLLSAQDEKGKTMQVKVTGIEPVIVEDQEMFAVKVVRPDGKVAPLTRRGTASPDDNVILMSREDLNGLAGQRYLGMANNGALDNSSNFMREMASMNDAVGFENARKEQALRVEVERMLETDPNFGIAEKRELYEMFSQLEKDELLQGVAGMGIDVDAVLEGYSADRAAEGKEGAKVSEAARDTTGLGNSETMGGDLSKAVDGVKGFFANPAETMQNIAGLGAITGISSAAPAPSSPETKAAEAELNRLASEIKKEQAASGNLTSPRLVELTKARDEAAKKFFAAQSADEAAAGGAAAPAKPIDPGSPANNSFKKAVDAGIAAISPQIESLRQRATGAVPVDSSQSTISPEIMAAPPEVQEAMLGEGLSPEERRQAILDAVETNLTKPTGKAVEYVRDYMIKNGYTTPESLSNAPSPEVMNIAFTIAANADVATSADRLNIAQSLLNFAQFGNTETNAQDVAKLQQARTGDSLAAQRLFFDRQKAELALEEKDRTRVNAAYNEVSDRTEIIRKSINTDDRGFWKKNPLPQDAVKEFSEVLKRARTSPDPVQKAAYQAAVGEILPTMLAAFALSEKRADLKEWVTGGFQDFFTRAKYRQISTDAGDFRVTYDDKGNPKFLYLLTPKGDDAEGGQINMQQLVGRFGPEIRDVLLSMIKETGELINGEE